MYRCTQIFATQRVNRLALFAILLTWMASRVVASPLVGYQLRMASDKRLLLAPNNPNVRMLVSKKTRYDRIIERMRPYFEIRNTSEEASLVNWQFSVGQEGYNFENIEILDEPSSNAGSTLAQSTLPLGTPNADLLALNFSGLTPGQSVIGRITLAADAPEVMQIPDFRNVLFQIDSPQAPEETGNAEIKTVFSDSTVLTGVLPNFSHNGSMLGPSLIFCSNQSSFEQEVFQFGQSGESVIAVPEPGTFVLALFGMVLLIGRRLTWRHGRC